MISRKTPDRIAELGKTIVDAAEELEQIFHALSAAADAQLAAAAQTYATTAVTVAFIPQPVPTVTRQVTITPDAIPYVGGPDPSADWMETRLAELGIDPSSLIVEG
jgi:hypothetical protein